MTMDLNQTETLEHLNARFAKALVPLTVTFGFFTIIGFAGNLLILLVFFLSREYRHNNFKIFVLCLGIIDFITCLTLIPAEMVKQRSYFSFTDATACKVKCFFNVFGASASSMALLVISVDRFRKVCLPLRTQLSPQLALKVLFVAAFVFPILLSIPGAKMCGIEAANKTNLYGGVTEIYLCATEDQYRYSVWRLVYKYVFVILLVGISFAYIILYSFVMKEVIQQVRSIAYHRKNSSIDVNYSTDTYDSNYACPDGGDKSGWMRQKSVESACSAASVEPCLSGSVRETGGDSGSSPGERQASVRSGKRKVSFIKRYNFPYKTMIWFILTLIFILTYITHLILALQVGDVVVMSTSEFASWSFFYRIYFLNHMINPLVYAIFVRRFRRSCVTLLPTLRARLSEALQS